MKKAEIELLQEATEKTLQGIAEQIIEADKEYERILGISIIDSANTFHTDILNILRDKDMDNTEAEQLHLFAAKDEPQAKKNNTILKLWSLFSNKAIHYKLRTLAPAEVQAYAKAQTMLFDCMTKYAALLVVQEALATLANHYRKHTRETLIEHILHTHLDIVGKEDIQSFFNTTIVRNIETFIDQVFNNDTSEKENFLRVPRTPIKTSTVLLSKPHQKIEEIQKAMLDPQFQEDIEKHGGVPVDISANKAGYNVYVSITNTMPEEVATTTKKLNEWDRAVFKGVCNILDSNSEITFLTVQNVYAGMTINGRLTPAREKKIADSLNKMRQTDVVIQCSEQQKIYAKQKKPKHIEAIYKNYMFPAATYIEKVKHPNGKEEETTIWKLLAEPPMYRYNNALNHKRSFKAKDIELPGIAMTDNVVILRDIILERIAIAENRKGAGNYAKINYEMLYKKIQTDEDQPLSRVEASRIRKQIQKILEQYKAKGLIASYSEYSTQSSNKARGIQIETPAKKIKSLTINKKNR